MGAYLPMGGAVDAAGNDRAAGGIPDAGAFERPAAPPSPTPSIANQTVYPSDLEWTVDENGWGPPERDMSNGEKPPGDGLTLTLNGQTFDRGIGAHAPSRIALDLGGTCTAFMADVGVDDEVGDRGTVVFEVLGDGRSLAATGIVVGSQGSVPIYADVTGVQSLELVVRAGGDGNGWDHADWGGARLDCRP
jgi:beta-galactosidase